jgi:hypothetical protein
MDRQIRNAKIESTALGYEGHGIMSAYLDVTYGGSSQTFGGWAMDAWKEELKDRVGTAYGMQFIIKILRVVGVERWEQLPGRHIRVDCEHTKAHGIGNILKDEWFYPEKDMAGFMEKGV